MSGSERISFQLNGIARSCDVMPNIMLIDLLRDRFGLAGTKLSCDQAVCGACTVLVNAMPIAACARFAFSVDGATVTTIEGLAAADGSLSAVQDSFLKATAFQCGFCTSGMIMLATALLAQNPRPSREEIVLWMSSNICRCTGYKMIIEAVEAAAQASRGGRRGGGAAG